jgi:Uri superfamily endonuclease
VTAGGVYCLLLALDRSATVDVGALGSVSFERGAYVYVGSAHGPGGFARVRRHRELADGDRSGCHWHVDYLLSEPGASVCATVTTADVDAECALARALSGERIPGFGCSDCDCPSHLARYPNHQRAVRDATGAHRAVAQSATSR